MFSWLLSGKHRLIFESEYIFWGGEELQTDLKCIQIEFEWLQLEWTEITFVG